MTSRRARTVLFEARTTEGTMPKDDLLTRPEAMRLLAERGFPVTKAAFNKMCAPGGHNSGPPVEGEAGQGRLHLYRADRLIEWAEQNLILVPRLVVRSDTSRRKARARARTRQADRKAA
jgi:hypothetical protein